MRGGELWRSTVCRSSNPVSRAPSRTCVTGSCGRWIRTRVTLRLTRNPLTSSIPICDGWTSGSANRHCAPMTCEFPVPAWCCQV